MAHLGNFSLRTLSAFNRPDERVAMALKCYYDGSGLSPTPKQPFISLAGFIASEDVWDRFEAEWGDVLATYPMCPKSKRGNPYFHSKEAFNFTDGFRGWDENQVGHLAEELFGVMKRFSGNLIGVSCTIPKGDDDAVRSAIPNLQSPLVTCLQHCIEAALRHPLRDSGIQCYFDRNEPFESELSRAVRFPANAYWAKYISSVSAIEDSRVSYAIQASDLLAWLANRYYTQGPNDLFGRFFFRIHIQNRQYHLFYDEKTLRYACDPLTGRISTLQAIPSQIAGPSGTKVKVKIGDEWHEVAGVEGTIQVTSYSKHSIDEGKPNGSE